MVQIKTKKVGAEIESIILDGKERIHNGEKFWNRHAPVLFPIVGKLKNDETIIEGKKYNMTQHGFARDMEFTKLDENSFVLKYSDETLKKYPYKFEMYISYEVNENVVTTNYKVINVDDKEMFFGLGGHPAFVCDYKKCEIEFEKEEDDIEFFQLENGLIKNECEKKEKFMKSNKIILNSNSFDNDAIIMKNIKSNEVIIKEDGKKIVRFQFKDFPVLAIWSKKDANFLCIEPWMNTADCINSDGLLKNKNGIIKLKPKEEFLAKFSAELF